MLGLDNLQLSPKGSNNILDLMDAVQRLNGSGFICYSTLNLRYSPSYLEKGTKGRYLDPKESFWRKRLDTKYHRDEEPSLKSTKSDY